MWKKIFMSLFIIVEIRNSIGIAEQMKCSTDSNTISTIKRKKTGEEPVANPLVPVPVFDEYLYSRVTGTRFSFIRKVALVPLKCMIHSEKKKVDCKTKKNMDDRINKEEEGRN